MNMQHEQLDDLGFCPSFSCYSSNTLASTAATRISNQLQQQQQQQSAGDEEFEFSFDLGENCLPIQNEVGHEPVVEEAIDCSETASSSSESDGESPAVFCVWRNRTDAGASPLSKCKKSGSTGSGSRRWRISDLLRRSNSEGLLSQKKVEAANRKGSSSEVTVVGGRVKPSIHELLYVQRGKGEGGRRKSYLPYRQGLVGFFSNVNGSGKKF
ncbi:hypothetical protein HanPSC8_Chr14g0626981 [Helianthus annuus]|nr:hypothetical protein HanPSC8_Chr14g0626981 [Helianthus annuus]